MPKGPKGQRRPADVIGNAVRVMEIATGQREKEFEAEEPKDKAAAELGRKGGNSRAIKLSGKKRAFRGSRRGFTFPRTSTKCRTWWSNF